MTSHVFTWSTFVVLLVAPGPAAGADFFVATNGNDANPGTAARPFASLEQARDAVRSLKAGSGLPAGGVTVWLRGGTYPRTRSFELTSADSGSSGAPVVYRNVRGEQVVLLGGRMVRAWHPVTDETVKAQLSPPARAQVLEADLNAAGVRVIGALHSRGFGRPTTPSHLELFFKAAPMTLARWPNEGAWEKIAGFPETSGQGDEHGGKIGALAGGFLYAGDRPRGWRDRDDVWVHGYWAWDWANSYEHVASLDLEKRWIRTAPPHGLYGFRRGQRFHFLNVLEELDQPDEYFVDRARARLYFWPPAPIAAGAAFVSELGDPILQLRDVSHVTFQGLALVGARGEGIAIRGGASNRVAGCALQLLGTRGVTIDGGLGHRVAGCRITQTGDGGVWLRGGDRQTLAPGGHVVEDCLFAKQGRWSKCYVPAVLLEGVGHRVAHNRIQDHPHCAILFSGNEHLIEFNEIHHVALETGDVGAIYAGRDWTYRGNRIRHNFIHHTGGVGMGSMGVYMDDCVSGTEIYGNLFLQVTRAAFLGGGRDHRVENNIFVDCHPAVQLDGRGLDPAPVWHDMVYDTMKKGLGAVPFELYRRRYPELRAVDRYYEATRGVPPEGNVVAHNLCAGGEWLQVGWHAKQALLEERDNYVGPDPGFMDKERADFRLRPDSPAWKLGFKKIPVEAIGPQTGADDSPPDIATIWK